MHIILTIFVGWVLVKILNAWLRERRTERWTASRLRPCDPTLHAEIVSWHRHQHETFDARHTVDWSPPPNLIADARDKHDRAKRARAAGFGSNAAVDAAWRELHALQGDLLAIYRR